MNQHFIIRKNKSLKELKVNLHQIKQPFGQCEQRNVALKQNCTKNNLKIPYLEPLMKTKEVPYRQSKQLAQARLEKTQPVHMKSACLAVTQHKQLPYQIENLNINLAEKHHLLQKQNRPASMNEIKYPSIVKMKPHFQTQKFQGLKVFSQFSSSKGFKKTAQTKIPEEQEKKQVNLQSLSKMKIMKSSSRSRLVKLHRQQREKQPKIQSEFVQQRPFRKGIIDKIMQNKKRNPSGQDFHQKQEENINSQKVEAKVQQKTLLQASFHSPKYKKEDINWDNCSTIKEQEESSESFLSKNPFADFNSSYQLENIQINFNENKAIFSRRPKIQVEKLKKKFPQNFFK